MKTLPKKASKLSKEFGEESDEEQYSDDIPEDDDDGSESSNERKMEEMAEDRRRRWQRSNPDAGRYRPSGDRMRSPNNC